MDPEVREALARALTGLADDELVLGHRDSEWCGHAPILEEDIAFANIALDEIGHARLWYQALADLQGEDQETFPDALVFRRAAEDYRCVRMVTLPRGDWAFTIVRQYLFDAYEASQLALLSGSAYRPVAETAAKIRSEERYHRRHTAAWVRRLGLGTDESRGRAQKALDTLWPFALSLFVAAPGEDRLVAEAIFPDGRHVEADWLATVRPELEEAQLTIPAAAKATGGRGEPADDLREILAEMQSVVRQYPDAVW